MHSLFMSCNELGDRDKAMLLSAVLPKCYRFDSLM
jgi:hypothetical protein